MIYHTSLFITYMFCQKKKNEDVRRYIDSQDEFTESFWNGLPITKQEFLDAIPVNPISVFSNDVYYTHEEDFYF